MQLPKNNVKIHKGKKKKKKEKNNTNHITKLE